MPEQEPQAPRASELASFGEELRREREIRGISLKEISDATKVSGRFLDALERNDHRTLPAPVFTRGFVREYARYLGLNTDEMVNRYNSAAASDDRIEKPPALARYPETLPRDIRPRPPRKRGIPPAWARVDTNAVALVVIALALAAVAWWAVKQRSLDRSEPAAESAVAGTPRDRPAHPVVAQPVPQAQPDTKLTMRLDTAAGSWVTLEADGVTVLNAEMLPGEQRTFEAQKEFRFRTVGNAGGVSLLFNGIPVPPLGDEGQVLRNRVFDRESLERLRTGAPDEPARDVEPPPAEPEPVSTT